MGLLLLLLVLGPASCRTADGAPLHTGTTELAAVQAGPLVIHQINVQQGDCTLIVGQDGTTILIDGGKTTKGSGEIVPYLASIGIHPSDGLDFMLCTHRDEDHLSGLDEVIASGYDVGSDICDEGVALWADPAGASIHFPDATMGASLGETWVAVLPRAGAFDSDGDDMGTPRVP